MASSAPSLLGREVPRVYTPPARDLTPDTSLGFAAVEFAEEVCGFRLYPWERWLLIHALELRPDGLLRFRTIVLLVARQNGKSTILQILALFAMFVLRRPLTIGTAQNLDIAEEVWAGAVDIAEGTAVLNDEIANVNRTNGKKALELVAGERYKVQAANRRGGRGLSGDLVLLDELREHQSWDAWGAVTKTTMARAKAQIWAASNAGDAASLVLRSLRWNAHLRLGNPDGLDVEGIPQPEIDDEWDVGDSVGLFEWSAPPGCAVQDRDGWAQANPSLGFSITERAIASALLTDPEWVFRTEVLCQWSDGSLEGPFPQGAWEAGQDPESVVPPGARFLFAVDVSWDRSTAHIAVAGRRADGLPHVEVVASRVGTDWVAGWLTERSGTDGLAGLVYQAKGAPVSSLEDELTGTGIPLIPWGGPDLGAATGLFYDQVRIVLEDPAKGVRHRPQPVLDVAAATAAMRPVTDAWAWDRKRSAQDIAPLVAATGALWGLETAPEPRVSPYETRGVMTVGAP